MDDTVTVSAQYTDILIILLHYWSPNFKNVYFETEKKEISVNIKKRWRVDKFISKQDSVHLLIFVHAWTGSNSTSAIHRKVKNLKFAEGWEDGRWGERKEGSAREGEERREGQKEGEN